MSNSLGTRQRFILSFLIIILPSTLAGRMMAHAQSAFGCPGPCVRLIREVSYMQIPGIRHRSVGSESLGKERSLRLHFHKAPWVASVLTAMDRCVRGSGWINSVMPVHTQVGQFGSTSNPCLRGLTIKRSQRPGKASWGM